MQPEPLFQPRPRNQKIPATIGRVVALLHSLNAVDVPIDGVPTHARASLLVVFTLRGGYHFYIYFAPVARGEGILYSSPQAEVAVGRYSVLEEQARDWLEGMGFELVYIPLGELSLKERSQKLAHLPFALKTDIHLSADLSPLGLASDTTTLAKLLGPTEPVEIMRRLRNIIVMS